MKAIIYSCHVKERSHEPDNTQQIALCQEYADQHGIEIVGNYMDCVASKNEPLLMKQLLFKKSRKRQWDIVLFSSITVLGRSVHEIMLFLSNLRKYVDYKIIVQENDPLKKEIGDLLEKLYKENLL